MSVGFLAHMMGTDAFVDALLKSARGEIMKFDIWRWLVNKEDFILSLLEVLTSARSLYGLRDIRWIRKGNEIISRHRRDAAGKDVVIVLNGPSISKQPLERLKGHDLVFVNQGFRHPAYKELQPKYHVMIDSKLIHGSGHYVCTASCMGAIAIV